MVHVGQYYLAHRQVRLTDACKTRDVDVSLHVAVLTGASRSALWAFTHVCVWELRWCVLPFRRWEGGDPGVSNQKTPTTILLTPDRKFHSFGYAARDFYHDLDPSESKQWLYLEKFKMKLHTTAVRAHTPRTHTHKYINAHLLCRIAHLASPQETQGQTHFTVITQCLSVLVGCKQGGLASLSWYCSRNSSVSLYPAKWEVSLPAAVGPRCFIAHDSPPGHDLEEAIRISTSPGDCCSILIRNSINRVTTVCPLANSSFLLYYYSIYYFICYFIILYHSLQQ